MAYMSVVLVAKSTKERCIRVPAIAIMIKPGCWKICFAESV
jgi:hypothetical protein